MNSNEIRELVVRIIDQERERAEIIEKAKI